jgi:hypothetical protein
MNKPALQETNTMNEFTLEEAVSLIYRTAILKKDAPTTGKMPEIISIGHICGVLTINEQIEVIIKFHDEMRQFTKEEFQTEIKLLD